jgi:serine protease Do
MKNHLLFALLCTLTFSISSFAQLPALVAKTEKAVFQIETFNEFGLTSSSGTGFFIDKNGTGLTAWHVIEDVKFAFIKDYSGKKYRIKKITRSNLDADLVEFILDTKQTNFPFIPLAASLPSKGTEVFTIGNPQGFEFSVSSGVVSGFKIKDSMRVIQTSTPISAGSSGGPLLNMQGHAVGVMSYSYSEGQNLNFAYSVLERKNMKKDSLINLMSDVNGEFYLLNMKAKDDPNLTLNSIEILDSTLALCFSYANLSITVGDNGYLVCDPKNKEETFFIREKDSITNHYTTYTSFPEKIEDAPTLKLGQAIHFRLYFDNIKSLKTFDLKENMDGLDWSFQDLTIPKKKYITSELFDQYKESQFFKTRMKLRRKDFLEAKEEIEKMKDSIKNNELLEQLAYVANYSLENYDEAIESINKDIQLNPTFSDYYADLHTVYMQMDRTTKAMDNINKAIQYNGDYAGYFFSRAELNYKLGNWKESIADYDKYLTMSKNDFAEVFMSRGIAKAKINDDSACADLEKAKDLAESDREWEKINKEYRKYCKQK